MLDTPVDIIQATVQLEQPSAEGQRTIGTGFLISASSADGTPTIVLVTANHVLAKMPAAEARIGYRSLGADGTWRYAPAPLKIRDPDGQPLWTRHPSQDVAVLKIVAPPEYARAAIPSGYLAPKTGGDLIPGDELMVLGFPRGVAANNAGFPILRSGRVASYPVSPDVAPTFLLDFSVFPGNSGGPVFITSHLSRASSAPGKPRIAGLLVQQVQLEDERLEIGIVTHARYIRETIELAAGAPQPGDSMMIARADQAAPVRTAAATPPPTVEPVEVRGARPAAEAPEPVPAWRRPLVTLGEGVAKVRKAAAGLLRKVGGGLADWIDPAPAVRRADAAGRA